MHFPDLRDGIWRQNKKRENAGSQTVCLQCLSKIRQLDIYNPYPIIFKGLTINYRSGLAKVSSGVPAVYFHELKKKICEKIRQKRKGGF